MTCGMCREWRRWGAGGWRFPCCSAQFQRRRVRRWPTVRNGKATGRQLVNVENGLTVNVANGPSEDDVTVIGSDATVIASGVNAAKAIAHAKRTDVKAASVLNANGPEVNRAVRIC
jgi:hypothetical protein